MTNTGDNRLVCITLHPPEAGMIDQFIIIFGALTIYEDYIKLPRLQQMFSGDVGYHQVFQEELSNLLAPPRPEDNIPATRKIVFLNDGRISIRMLWIPCMLFSILKEVIAYMIPGTA